MELTSDSACLVPVLCPRFSVTRPLRGLSLLLVARSQPGSA